MKEVKITLPKLGESIVVATIINWFKKEGDLIEKDEALLEVATDKVNSEIPSPVSGKVTKLLAKAQEEVKVGQEIAVISTAEDIEISKDIKKKPEAKSEKDSKTFFSPAVLRYAKEHNIDISELENIEGSGEGKRITKKDIEEYISSKKVHDENVINLSPIRKRIADNMEKSYSEIPHAYLIDEIDITEIMEIIEENKTNFLQKNNAKLTITTFISYAIAKAVKKYPLLNSTYDKNKILLKKDINLGLAVSHDDAVLVPVIKKVQNLNIVDISKNITDLAKKVRSNKITIDDTKDGSITLTNFGMASTLMGFPIIKYPEAAIIGLGAVKKRAILTDSSKVVNRAIVMITLAFDHRIFDGMYACSFLNEIKHVLEDGHKISI